MQILRGQGNRTRCESDQERETWFKRVGVKKCWGMGEGDEE